MEHRRRLIRIAAAAAVTAALAPISLLVAPSAAAGASGPTANASVVSVKHYRAPRKVVIHRKFRPWAHPTPAEVRTIINNEARTWHISAAALSTRVACESRYHWWASNGQYQGVLQFGPNAFYRGLRTIRSFKVTLIRSRIRTVHDAWVTTYSNGQQVRRRSTPRHQRVIVIYTGRLPRHPALGNAYAQIRIGAQAIRGISAVSSSEWACAA